MNELIRQILDEHAPERCPYLTALGDGSLTREEFVETQIQFYFAVVFFSRPMAAVAAKIPTQSARMEVVRNVWEEHGEGDPARFHGTTFIEFLRRLGGIEPGDVEARSLWPEVRAFNTTLAGVSVLDEHRVGVATFGIIERMFADISHVIARAVVERGFVSAEQMIHYDLHETLDHHHAEHFFRVVRDDFDEPEHAYIIEQGLRLGATIFSRLYEDLFRHRARRWLRPVRGPHVRV